MSSKHRFSLYRFRFPLHVKIRTFKYFHSSFKGYRTSHFSAVVVKKKKRKGKHEDWGPSRTGKEKVTPGSGVMFPHSGSDLPGAIKPLVDIVANCTPPPPPPLPQHSESSLHPAKSGSGVKSRHTCKCPGRCFCLRGKK